MNHPRHYRSHPSGVECIDVVEHLNFCCGNAVKYLWRSDEKGKLLEDTRKALWYLEREIARQTQETWAPFPLDSRREISSRGAVRISGNQVLVPMLRADNGFEVFCDSEGKLHMLHAAMARTFFGTLETGHEVRHRDLNKNNNRIQNLCLVPPRTEEWKSTVSSEVIYPDDIMLLRSTFRDGGPVPPTELMGLLQGADWPDPASQHSRALMKFLEKETRPYIAQIVSAIFRNQIPIAANLVRKEIGRLEYLAGIQKMYDEAEEQTPLADDVIPAAEAAFNAALTNPPGTREVLESNSMKDLPTDHHLKTAASETSAPPAACDDCDSLRKDRKGKKSMRQLREEASAKKRKATKR